MDVVSEGWGAGLGLSGVGSTPQTGQYPGRPP